MAFRPRTESVESLPAEAPEPASFAAEFHVYDVVVDDGVVYYYGEPLTDRDAVVKAVAGVFRPAGYRVRLRYDAGEYVLEARERSTGVDGVPWTNVGLLIVTLGTTLLAGATWYGRDATADPTAALAAWPFAAGVLGVLAVHEFGHYVASRRHEVQASLPYFIPVPTLLGTLGAVIRLDDQMPDRDALFDIGAAGPLAGLVATVVVGAVGLTLPPVSVPPGSVAASFDLGYPPLLIGLARLLGEQLAYPDPGTVVNPVVVGAWVGAFVTFLNLLPIGQLDGGHVLQALAGDGWRRFQAVVPLALFTLGGGLLALGRDGVGVWFVWGVLGLLFSRTGGATVVAEAELSPGRRVLGVVTFLLGLLCFTPVPISVAL